MGLRTPLYETHVAAGARIVDFGGWDMPVNYGSQIEEHHGVRRDAGMFDVSHMCVVDLRGERVRDFLRRLLANDVARLTVPGKALYSCMLRENGGVIDDLIVYYLDDRYYRLVVNAGTRDKDIDWLRAHAGGFEVAVEPRFDLAMIAVQGPNAQAEGGHAARRGPRRPCARPRQLLRHRRRPMVRRTHRIHGRGRLGDHSSRGRSGRFLVASAWRRRDALWARCA